jgi:chromosome segregation ATPase
MRDYTSTPPKQSRQSVMARIQTFEKSSTSPNDATVFYVSPVLSRSLGDLEAILDEPHLSLDDHHLSPPPRTTMMMSGDDNNADDNNADDNNDDDDKPMRMTNALQNRLDVLRKKYNKDHRTLQSQEMELKRLRQECQVLQEHKDGNGNDDLEIDEHLRQHVHELQQALEQERRQNQKAKEELHLYQTTEVQEHEITIQDKDSMIQGLEAGLQMANDALATKEHAYKANIADLEEQELQAMRSSKEALQMVHATLETKDADISLLQAKLHAAQDAMLVQTNTIAELQDKLETKRTSSSSSTPTKKKKKKDGSKSKTSSKK